METFSAQVLDTKSPTDFLDYFAHLRGKSNEALDVDGYFLRSNPQGRSTQTYKTSKLVLVF